MKAPDKIYLQICGDCPGVDSCKTCKFKDLEDNVTWCADRIFPKDKEYIRKGLLLHILAKKKEEVGIGLSEYDMGKENGKGEVLNELIEEIKVL